MNIEIKHQLTKIFLLLFAIFSTLLIALAFKFYYAFSTTEDVITNRYYEIGADYDSYLKEMINSPDRKLTLYPDITSIKSGANSIRFSYESTTDKKSAPIAQGEIFMEISKRATTRGKIEKKCTTDSSGNCSISFDLHPGARYDINIHAKDNTGKYNIKKSIEL